ncbi:MAG: aldo/keto reductase [Verrucomicrobiota bacterium]
MHYRRFGRTELEMPVFSCGGMRFQHGWEKLKPQQIPASVQENLEATVHRALELGIRHIETAEGYGPSEMQLGFVLPKIDRDKFWLQTKAAPQEDGASFEAELEESFKLLGLEQVDLLSIHGINNHKLFEDTFRKGGPMDVIRRWQKEGRIRFVGFSTHGHCHIIEKAINTGEFDYVNLHWYFINQSNWAAVEAAQKQDMGVFIISPTDKGGQLHLPSEKLVRLCEPLTPMAFNDLFCLKRPEVHTLSIGASKPGDFDAHIKALEHYDTIEMAIQPIEERIHAAMIEALGADWWPRYAEGLPNWDAVPGEINLQYILRIWSLATGLDMTGYGRYRYGMIGNGDHWMAGQKATNFDDETIIAALDKHPQRERIPDILRKAHELFKGKERKPLSQH